LITDRDGTVLQCNESLLRIEGLPRKEIVGRSCWTILTGTVSPESDDPFPQVIPTAKRVSVLMERKGRSFGIRIDPMRDEAGNQVGAIFTISDVTDRIRAGEAERRIRDTLEALVAASPAAIVAMDPGGMITEWNPAAERLFGWTAREAIGSPNPIVPEEFIEEHQGFRERVMAGETLTGIEARRRRKDGSPIDTSFSMAPLRDAAGGTTGMVVIALDITELKHAGEVLQQREEEVRQLQKMDAIGRLAGGMAHDLNNILTAVIGYSDILASRLTEEPNHSHAETVLKSAQQAAELCRHLLTFSRRQVYALSVLRLNDVLSRADHLVRPLIGEDVELTVRPAPGLWFIKGNEAMVQQVILNMAVNAREAMPSGGKLVIETANVELDRRYTDRHPGTAPGEYAVLAVSDTGHGMTPEVKSHLFEPFFTTKEGGNGLGLSTAYGMVTQTGGHINVYSEPGQGSTFKVYFPRTTETGAPEPPPTRERRTAPAGGTETVLVVEDRPELRGLVRDVLTGHGYRVVLARDGVEAVRIARARPAPFDLVLTDLVMPQMNGQELAGLLAGFTPGVRILFMSGYTDTILVQQGLLGSRVPFLHKPFTPDGLLAKVREVLDSPAP